MEALRIKLEMPQAHFRKPWAFSIRHTYLVPPFSTVIGLLCNIIGNGEELFEEDFGLAIFSKFSSMDCEYTWLRNLRVKAHKSKYLSKVNRELSKNNIEHPGGQSPVRIFVLNNLEIKLYLFSENNALYNRIRQGLKEPEKWYSHLHLGRSEDWINLKSVEKVKLKREKYAGKTGFLTWVPSPTEHYHKTEFPDYQKTFQKLSGRSLIVPEKYEMVEIENTVLRNFNWKKVKILESQLYPITLTSDRFEYYLDHEIDNGKVIITPVIFTRIKGEDK